MSKRRLKPKNNEKDVSRYKNETDPDPDIDNVIVDWLRGATRLLRRVQDRGQANHAQFHGLRCLLRKLWLQFLTSGEIFQNRHLQSIWSRIAGQTEKPSVLSRFPHIGSEPLPGNLNVSATASAVCSLPIPREKSVFFDTPSRQRVDR